MLSGPALQLGRCRCRVTILWPVLLCLIHLPADAQAVPRRWLAAGLSAELADLNRWGVEVRFGRTIVSAPRALVLGARFGGYKARPTIGRRVADSLGFEPDAEPSFTSFSIAIEQRLGADRTSWQGYARLAGLLTHFGGQQGRLGPGGLPEGGRATVSGRFGAGAEMSVGLRHAGGKVRPWAELLLIAEQYSGAGWLTPFPVFGAGIEIGGGW
jgi:hypothetical protein